MLSLSIQGNQSKSKTKSDSLRPSNQIRHPISDIRDVFSFYPLIFSLPLLSFRRPYVRLFDGGFAHRTLDLLWRVMDPAVEVFFWIFDEVAGVVRSKESDFQGGAFMDLTFPLQIWLMLYAMVAHGIQHRLAPPVFFLLYYFKGFFNVEWSAWISNSRGSKFCLY